MSYEFAEIVAASEQIRFCRLYIFSTVMLQPFLAVMVLVTPELQFLTFGDNFFFLAYRLSPSSLLFLMSFRPRRQRSKRRAHRSSRPRSSSRRRRSTSRPRSRATSITLRQDGESRGTDPAGRSTECLPSMGMVRVEPSAPRRPPPEEGEQNREGPAEVQEERRIDGPDLLLGTQLPQDATTIS